ncbi:uncharacterized protein ACHE_51029A [Aspergillus chevalieri]|uniref:Uncharacterized protein n=1 Tax=Aspergillus chevalieri TaxID=182096 RepID=A0A7R7VS65_ASPCH|nr:uncharacterized protein ACHE_51029A [Aspergillus chevalieri]BCR89831.1 hypothetical protein ACHE_51029A [Aspergillus chevalieri]
MAIPYRHNQSLTPSLNLDESRESRLNADELPQNNTNMQDVDMQNVDAGMNDNYKHDDNNGNSNSDDNANGPDRHSPSSPSSPPPVPSSTLPPDSSELMLIQHQKQWIEHEGSCSKIQADECIKRDRIQADSKPNSPKSTQKPKCIFKRCKQ